MKAVSFYLFLFWNSYVIGQNLVFNPSFEIGATCDGQTERIDSVDGWTAVAGNPSYINTNCPLSKESKSFVQGMRLPPASHGKVLSIQKFDLTTECQQGQLISPLEKGKEYIVHMRVRLPIQFCQMPINEVGVILSDQKLEQTTERRSIDKIALALQNNTQSSISKQYEWEEVSALYTAKGGERYIAIGNFSNTNVGLFDNRSKKECTYLFIDAVSIEIFQEQTLVSYVPDMPLKKNQRLLLSDVLFEEGSAVLKKTSFTSLQALANTLLKNPNLKVEISSYTDNSLDALESIVFSEARAKAIVKYLEDQNVLNNQLVAIGRGSKNAIALNNSVNNRKKNERIEIKFIEL